MAKPAPRLPYSQQQKHARTQERKAPSMPQRPSRGPQPNVAAPTAAGGGGGGKETVSARVALHISVARDLGLPTDVVGDRGEGDGGKQVTQARHEGRERERGRWGNGQRTIGGIRKRGLVLYSSLFLLTISCLLSFCFRCCNATAIGCAEHMPLSDAIASAGPCVASHRGHR